MSERNGTTARRTVRAPRFGGRRFGVGLEFLVRCRKHIVALLEHGHHRRAEPGNTAGSIARCVAKGNRSASITLPLPGCPLALGYEV